MAANTTIVYSSNKAALLNTIAITDVADGLTNNNNGTYTYGAYTFESPDRVPVSGDLLVLQQSGANQLMPVAVYNSNYAALA